jgi:hypothetical protein
LVGEKSAIFKVLKQILYLNKKQTEIQSAIDKFTSGIVALAESKVKYYGVMDAGLKRLSALEKNLILSQ